MIYARLLRHLVITMTVLLSAIRLLGQEAVSFPPSEVTAINEMLQRYSDAFMRKDYATIRNYVQTPFVTFPGETKIYDTVDAVMQYYRIQRDPLDERGYDHTNYVESRLTALSTDRALVNKTYRRLKKDGSLLEERAAIYLVSKSSGSWKICGLFSQTLALFGKVY